MTRAAALPGADQGSRQTPTGLWCLLFTCEHAGNRVPAAYQGYFLGHASLLQSHRGYDPGALTLARELARRFQAPVFYAMVSRLVVDLNRSVGHPRLYSEVTRALPQRLRQRILQDHYLPYRARVEHWVGERVAAGRSVLHIACHSFTPALGGEVRRADIGLLYDPARTGERAFCLRWRAALRARAGDLRVRLNYPYTGRSDGLTAWLRRRFPEGRYLGIELEVNQRYVFGPAGPWRALRTVVRDSLAEALSAGEGPEVVESYIRATKA